MDTTIKANRDIKSLQPTTQKACKLFLDACKQKNIPIFITETHRSQKRQDYLYEQGRTRPGKIVTWTRSSNHTGGYAWDIAVNAPHDLYDSTIIAKAGAVAATLNIEWGGKWKKKDAPHFQINKDWSQPEMIKQIDINIEGKVKKVAAIEKDDSNYIKLRDLEEILSISFNKMPIITRK